jgi:hypothetical protein
MTDAAAQAKETQAKSAEQKQKSVEEAYAHQGTPTPTQEECDLAALGQPMDEHADDGSGPSPVMKMTIERNSEAQKPSGGDYRTRNLETGRDPQRPASSQHPAAKEPPKEPAHKQT